LPTIVKRLLKLQWNAKTPAAIIHWGTTPQQQVVEGTLGTIAARADAAGLTSPVLIIIGKVVNLRKKLRWFDIQPLFGKRIAITRATEQAPEFASLLESQGAEVLAFPTIQIAPPRDFEILDHSIKHIDRFDWILFTSVNGVRYFTERLFNLGHDIRHL